MLQHKIKSVDLVGSTIPELVAQGIEWWVGTCACGYHTQRYWFKEQASRVLGQHISGAAGGTTAAHNRKQHNLDSAATA